MKTFAGLMLGVIAIAAVSATAHADGHMKNDKLMTEIKSMVSDSGAAEIIYKRRMAMRELGGNMKTIAGFVKAGAGSANDVAAAGMKISEIAKMIPDLFPAGTSMDSYAKATGAKAVIWEQSGDFKSAAMNLAAKADDLAKVASADGADEGTIGAAFGTLGKDGCGSCHRTFRQKLN
jgi:cytochrome c556